MRDDDDREFSGLAAEAERAVAWLRLPAIALLLAGRGLSHPNPQLAGFLAVIAAFGVWSVLLLVWVYRRPVSRALALAATTIDAAAITVLALLSGGPFSQARLAYFLVPVAVAFRFQPVATAVAAGATAAAYLGQALARPARNNAEASRFIAVHTGYLLWIGAAAVLLSTLLWRRTRRILELAAVRRRLFADVLTAEQERTACARREPARQRDPEPALVQAGPRGGCGTRAAPVARAGSSQRDRGRAARDDLRAPSIRVRAGRSGSGTALGCRAPGAPRRLPAALRSRVRRPPPARGPLARRRA